MFQFGLRRAAGVALASGMLSIAGVSAPLAQSTTISCDPGLILQGTDCVCPAGQQVKSNGSGQFCVAANSTPAPSSTPSSSSSSDSAIPPQDAALLKALFSPNQHFYALDGSLNSIFTAIILNEFTDFSLFGNDPYLEGGVINDKGATVTSASGAVSRQSVDSRTTFIGGGVDGHVNVSHVFNLTPDQRLSVGAFVRYDSFRTTYGADPLTPGLASAGSQREGDYRFAAIARYDVGDTYFGVMASGTLGSGDETDNVFTATGSYRTHGYLFAADVGHVFTLFDSTSIVRPLPTKAPPKAVSGYSVKLDTVAYVGFARDQINGFTDTAGFVRGDETTRFDVAGGRAKLFATTTIGRLTWSPFVAATVDTQFNYSHTLDIPVQTAFAVGDTIYYGSPQTFWGLGWGVDLVDVSGVRFGVNGFYRKSAEYDMLGGQGYIKFPISTWLTPQPVFAR